MPRDIQSFTECTGPGSAMSHKNFDGLLGVIVSSVLTNKANFIAAFVVLLTASFIFLGCYGFLPFYVTLMALLPGVKDWYFNTRLLCVNAKLDNCVIGMITHKPEVSFDGDRKMNILPAPFSRKECVEKLVAHLNANRQLLSDNTNFSQPIFFNGSAPALPFSVNGFPDPLDEFFLDTVTDQQDREFIFRELANYMNRLESDHPEDDDATSDMYSQFLIGYLDRLLSPNNLDMNGEPKNFYNKYMRKDGSVITPGSALWNAIPEDYDPAVDWHAPNAAISPLTGPNPYEGDSTPRRLNMMFRFENSMLTPYMHCEIDGNVLSHLIDYAMIALTAFAAAVTALCIFLGPLAALFGAVWLAIFFWWLYELLFEDLGVGDAGMPDIDFEDPENLPPDESQQKGDTVVIYGRWIMDTEHTQYFEIHPVKAFYILARNPNTSGIEFLDSHDVVDQNGLQVLNNTLINKSLADEICKMVGSGEKDPIPEVIPRTTTQVLSYGLNTNYGGGGIL